MRREDIPWRLAASRGQLLARIPSATLAKMAPCDLAPRLLAHDAMIRKARVPHLDHDLYRLRIRMATDALTETDPRAVAAIMKAAGVAWSGHDPMVGRHTHAHPSFGSQGADATHEHEHSHDGDANHKHRHAAVSAKSAASTRPPVSGALAKAAPPPPPGRRDVPSWGISHGDDAPSVRVNVPVLDGIASDSGKIIARAGNAGQLGAMAREIGQLEKAEAASAENLPGKAARWEQLAKATPEPVQAATYRQMARDARERLTRDADHLSKAADYEAKAARMSSAEDRGTYLELAAQERQKAGAL
jgi:hypothetical protein